MVGYISRETVEFPIQGQSWIQNYDLKFIQSSKSKKEVEDLSRNIINKINQEECTTSLHAIIEKWSKISIWVSTLTSWGYHSTQHPKKRAILPHPLLPLELYALLSNSPTAKPPKITSISLHFHSTHPKNHTFFLMFKLKFEGLYIYFQFNTELSSTEELWNFFHTLNWP